MSNREDYLDSLLKSVTTSEKDKKSSKLGSEDKFLMDFEQDLLNMDEDDFLKEFESILDEKPELDKFQQDSDIKIDTMDYAMDDLNVDTMDYAVDGLNVDTMGSAEDELMVNTMNGDDFSGLKSEPVTEDIDAMLMAAMGSSDFAQQEPESEAESDLDVGFEYAPEPEGTAEEELPDDTSELWDILAGMSGDDDLTDIGNMLKAHDSDEIVELSPDELEKFDMEGSDMILEEEAGGKSDKKGKKKKKEKESGGFFKKMSAAFFGDDEDVIIPEEGELGSISNENMEILKEMEKKEKKARKKAEKKEEKTQKKAEKKELKAQKKAEKKEQAEQKKAAKKEQQLREPVVKSKPLPKGPVFLIFLMVGSLVVLIYLGSSLIGYETSMSQAESKYDQGAYVEAYELLRGMEIKDVDREFYNKARLTAYMEKELTSYHAYIGKEMYAEALDALICAIGKYDKHGEDAAEVGAGVEFGSMFGDAKEALAQTFGVTVKEAREVYKQQDREAYTVQLYVLLERAGLAE